jgi:hypothetical protein
MQTAHDADRGTFKATNGAGGLLQDPKGKGVVGRGGDRGLA